VRATPWPSASLRTDRPQHAASGTLAAVGFMISAVIQLALLPFRALAIIIRALK
jgi:hypothetical protein